MTWEQLELPFDKPQLRYDIFTDRMVPVNVPDRTPTNDCDRYMQGGAEGLDGLRGGSDPAGRGHQRR